MSWKTLGETVAEHAKAVLRKGYPLRSTLTFDVASDIIDSVVIDQDALKKTVLKHLVDKTKNPLNDILGLLGFRIISNRKLDGEEEDALESVDFNLDAYFDIDGQKLDEVLERAAKAQLKQEETNEAEKAALLKRFDKLQAEYLEYQEKSRETLDEYQAREAAIANHVQYMMAMRRLAEGASADFEDCLTLLSDMEMEAVWPDAAPEEERPAMFTVLKTSITGGVGIKPCIMKDGRLFLKGVIIETVE